MSSNFGVKILPALLRFPHELVWFEASEIGYCLALNPELGTFSSLTQPDFLEFRKFIMAPQHIQPNLLSITLKENLAQLIIRQVIYYGNYTPQIDEAVPHVPDFVYWETSFGCNLRCVYCYMSAAKPKPDELTTEEALEMISEMADIGVRCLVFTGGEPLLRKDIWQLAKYAKSQSLVTQVITNATLIKSIEIAERVRDCFDHVTTSLDGACPEHNDLHRGKGSFRSIVRGIQSLNQVGIKPIINSAISNYNVAHVTELLDFVEQNFEVKSHRTMPISKIGRGHETEYDLEDWENYKRLHDATTKKLFENVRSRPEVLMQEFRRDNFLPRKNCGMGSGEIYIDSKGNVYPCKLVTIPEWYSGNIRETSLTQILDASPLRKSRNLSVTGIAGCRTCMIRRLCGGGCRGNHLGISGDVLKNNPGFCWTLRHRMVASLWMAENKQQALLDSSAFVPRVVATGEVWKPEIGSALPKQEIITLPVIDSRILTLAT
jgi:radical SAM protein with 4Fe4S-binding SPASM domain